MSLLMRWCDRCRRRFYEDGTYCPFDGNLLEAPDRAAGSDPHLGATLLGQVHLVAEIGRGAMGTVYRAWQSGMERPVAVKILRSDLLGDPALRRRFVREARAAAQLSHPNIVCVHLVGETEAGVPYLVMEHLGGETLEDVLGREGRLPPRRALAVTRQIACALAEAHAAGIVHRDLKPANVMVQERRGVGELVKILDFGIAKIGAVLPVAGSGPRPIRDSLGISRQGAVFGTPHYIAPEQAAGCAVDGRADLYSLGVLLYRMLGGRLPFYGSGMSVLIAHLAATPPHLGELAPDLDPRVAGLVMRLLAKAPDDRVSDADALAAALAALEETAAGAAASSWPDSSERPWRWPEGSEVNAA
jgi:serine/threonine-protein kinase